MKYRASTKIEKKTYRFRSMFQHIYLIQLMCATQYKIKTYTILDRDDKGGHDANKLKIDESPLLPEFPDLYAIPWVEFLPMIRQVSFNFRY